MEAGDKRAALCLAGGNALGAYQAGFVAALLEAGFAFPVIAGSSVGGLIAALVAGNRGAARGAALKAFAQAAQVDRAGFPVWSPFGAGLRGRRAVLMQTLLTGHPRLFRPRVPGLLSALAGVETGRALYDRSAMRRLVAGLVDFGLLNDGTHRLLLTATDAETGEPVVFDSAHDRIGLDHLMATSAFPVLFPPEKLGGRWLVDGGLRRNLPLDLMPDGLPVIALDLFPLAGGLPETLTGMGARAQDILLAGQTAEALARFLARGQHGGLVHAVYENPADMTATKTLDYSARMLAVRRAAGQRDAAAMLTAWPVAAGTVMHVAGGRVPTALAAPVAQPVDAGAAGHSVAPD